MPNSIELPDSGQHKVLRSMTFQGGYVLHELDNGTAVSPFFVITKSGKPEVVLRAWGNGYELSVTENKKLAVSIQKIDNGADEVLHVSRQVMLRNGETVRIQYGLDGEVYKRDQGAR